MSNLTLKAEQFIIPKENIEITTILDVSFTTNEVIFIIKSIFRKYFYKALFSDLKIIIKIFNISLQQKCL